MFCQNCGKQIPENAKFCGHCGAAQANSSTYNTQQKKQTTSTQQRSSQQTNEKAFKKYVAPSVLQKSFIVMAVLTVVSLVAMPPAGVGLAVIAIMLGIVWANRINKMNKRISQMQANGTYDKMLLEFGTSASMLDGKIRCSENFIFGKDSSSFFTYQEIYWLYRHSTKYLFIPIRSAAMIGDNNGKVASFCKLKSRGNAGNEEIKALAYLILKKNPHVLLGFDAAKQTEYKKRTK